MHQYRHKKLPVSFENMFQEITENDALQTRHNDYNFIDKPAINRYLEKFPTKQCCQILLSYSSEPECDDNCYIGNDDLLLYNIYSIVRKYTMTMVIGTLPFPYTKL